MNAFLLFLFILSSFHFSGSTKEHKIDIFVNEEISNLKHFWESTGLCPPLPHVNASDFLLSDDMMQNLLLISSVPHGGIKQVRIHWLLELITKKNEYDFTNLDRLISFLHSTGLKPGFEIMGNPSNFFDNFDDPIQLIQFKSLVSLLAKRYIDMYGLEYVSKWNFETWNEPDHKDFDNITITVEGFIKYYDACSEALNAVNPSLVFGGPGGSCRQPSYSKRCWALLNHIANDKNFGAAEHSGRLNYISIHKKGQGRADTILQTELETISKIHQLYPSLSSTPIYNDEGDPLVGWSKPQWWRADATYAAVIAKVIAQHQNQVIANSSRASINYSLLSNDNAFLSYSPHYFTQRTLNARFQINNSNPSYNHFVKKPALAVMALLSKLGDIQIHKTLVNKQIGGISSVCSPDACASPEVSTLLHNSADTENVTGASFIKIAYHNLKNLSLKFNIVSFNDAKVVTCHVNNLISNPYQEWSKFGMPDFPSASQFKKIHESEEPSCSDPQSVKLDEQGVFIDTVNLPLPGVLLHHICWKLSDTLQQPINLKAYNITLGQVLLTWQDIKIASKCIKSYNVQFAQNNRPDAYVTVNNRKVIFNSFIFISNDQISGRFRVQAIDYWDGKGAFSDVLTYIAK